MALLLPSSESFTLSLDETSSTSSVARIVIFQHHVQISHWLVRHASGNLIINHSSACVMYSYSTCNYKLLVKCMNNRIL